MNGRFKVSIIMVMAVAIFTTAAYATDQDLLTPPFGFADEDANSVNDLFQDANGDGVDDVTGKAYRHSFQYRDDDNDGKNDLFQDANGDGVNDIFMPGSRARRRGLVHSLDADKNGQNDVNGAPIPTSGFGRHAGGQQWDDFVDEDGDGIDDRRGWGNRWRKRHGQGGQRDDTESKDGKGHDEDKGGSNNNGKGKGKNDSSRHHHR